jgi:curved DNA-binding protein CbpA
MNADGLPEYEPREGIDYLVDLYAVLKVPQTADEAVLGQALDKRILEYHPDRVRGLADEFQVRAARMGELLVRARKILRNSKSRDEYNEILNSWTGPISTDGDPVITIERYVMARAAMMSPTDIDGLVGEIDNQIVGMLGADEGKLAAAKRMVDKYPDDEELHDAYEERLLEQDRVLALKETKRRELAGAGSFGLVEIDKRGYRVGLGYGETVAGEIEDVKEQRLVHVRKEAIAGTAARLAILAGERPEADGQILPASSEVTLPASYVHLTTQIAEIAEQREEIVNLRLANLQPVYPEADRQSEPRPTVLVGLQGAEKVWLGFHRTDTNTLDNFALDEELLGLLHGERYAEIIERGIGLIECRLLEQIEPEDILNELLNKYYGRS